MSTLATSNLFFESTGNTRIQYNGANSFSFYAGGVEVFSTNTTTLDLKSGIYHQTSGPSGTAFTALSDGANIAVNCAAASNFEVTLGGNRNLDNPSGQTTGQEGFIKVTQDGTGSRTLSYSSYWKFDNDVAPTLTTNNNRTDVIRYIVVSGTIIHASLLFANVA